MMQKRISFWIGLAFILAYWWSVMPPNPARMGYFEDLCMDIVRQLMSENLDRTGRPGFVTDRVMAPFQVSIPYMSWTIERDWLGALFWRWSSSFPFLWAYYGASLLLSYIGVGAILKRMWRESRVADGAWYFAALVVLLHVPRHFKTYHHWEMLPQHFVYLAFFLDAWILREGVAHRTWSWSREAWRGVLQLLILTGAGYWWGFTLVEWALVRIALCLQAWSDRSAGTPWRTEWSKRSFSLATVTGLATAAMLWTWFQPLAEEVKKAGTIWQPAGFTASFGRFFQPLWLDWLWSGLQKTGWALHDLRPINAPETVVSVGWTLWIPGMAGLVWAFRQSDRRWWRGAAGPWLVFLVFLMLYGSSFFPADWREAVRRVLPFLSYVRTTSRIGLLLPVVLGVMGALFAPQIWSAFMRARSRMRPRWFASICVAIALQMVGDAAWLLTPINAMERMPADLETVFAQVKEAPGDLVLDMPYCVAGGNGYCTGEQCPQYPRSMMGQCFRLWHGKGVYGLYQARMTDEYCQLYRRTPFMHWMDAWRTNRCFTDSEFSELCDYLDTSDRHSALFLYPELWPALQRPDCREKWERHFGAPKQEIRFSGGRAHDRVETLWLLPGKCQAR